MKKTLPILIILGLFCISAYFGLPYLKKVTPESVNKGPEVMREDDFMMEEDDNEIPADCVSWFDGCNNCIVMEGEMAACTRKYCPPEMMEASKCLKYAEEDSPAEETMDSDL